MSRRSRFNWRFSPRTAPQRWHRPTYLKAFATGSAEVDPLRIPQYYRDKADLVSGWFLLTQIEPVEFSAGIAKRLGESTLLVLDGAELRKTQSEFKGSPGERSCLLHLSDLHFGADYAYLPQGATSSIGDHRGTLTECLLADLKRIGATEDIAIVLVTGDFTTRGDWSDKTTNNALEEFRVLQTALQIDKNQIVPVPGNHDIVRYPPGTEIDISSISVGNQTTYKHEHDFRLFIDKLNGSDWKDPLNYIRSVRLRDVDLLICALNSCTITATEWTEYGYVGTKGLDVLSEMRSFAIKRPTYRFMALHHHLLPVARVETPASSGVSLSLDASDLLDAAQNAGVHVAVHGHQHMPRIARYQTIPLMGSDVSAPVIVVSNGSAGVIEARRPGSERNTYCVFQLQDDGVHLSMRELRPDAREGATLYSGPLNVKPAVL